MANSPLRRTVGVLSSLLLATLFVTGFAGTAQAKDGYRYWNYFHLAGNSWEFSQVGAAEYDPQDGDVEGYRFGTTTASDMDGVPPRADLDEVTFDAICTESAAAGEKRVAVVLDYGTKADADGATPPAPIGRCAVVDAEANGAQVLQAVADVRIESAMSCAIDGYPVKGCGAPVKDAQDTANEEFVAFDMPSNDAAADDGLYDPAEEESDLLWPLVGVGLVVVLIAASALAMNRRKSSA